MADLSSPAMNGSADSPERLRLREIVCSRLREVKESCELEFTQIPGPSARALIDDLDNGIPLHIG